jgi:hypothetical protein
VSACVSCGWQANEVNRCRCGMYVCMPCFLKHDEIAHTVYWVGIAKKACGAHISPSLVRA